MTFVRNQDDIWDREKHHVAIRGFRLRRHALYLPENKCRCAPNPCVYQIPRHDYSRLRFSCSGPATDPLTVFPGKAPSLSGYESRRANCRSSR